MNGYHQGNKQHTLVTDMGTFLMGMRTTAATLEISLEIYQKTKNKTTILPSQTTPGHMPKFTLYPTARIPANLCSLLSVSTAGIF